MGNGSKEGGGKWVGGERGDFVGGDGGVESWGAECRGSGDERQEGARQWEKGRGGWAECGKSWRYRTPLVERNSCGVMWGRAVVFAPSAYTRGKVSIFQQYTGSTYVFSNRFEERFSSAANLGL